MLKIIKDHKKIFLNGWYKYRRITNILVDKDLKCWIEMCKIKLRFIKIYLQDMKAPV